MIINFTKYCPFPEGDLDMSVQYKFPTRQPQYLIGDTGVIRLRWDSSTSIRLRVQDLEWMEEAIKKLKEIKDETRPT